MTNSNPPRFSFPARTLATLAATLAILPAAAYNHVNDVAPQVKGPFTVACSNVTQDPNQIAPGALAIDYWEGRDHYITEILAYPQSTVRYNVRVPLDPIVYPGNFGRNVDFVAIVCYPTSASNPDPDYVLPQTGDVVPHMQPPGTAPRLLSALDLGNMTGTHVDPLPPPTLAARFPLIVFSHGLTGSPISPGYVDAMTLLASHGFMVGAVFHGDPRFSRTRIQDLSDAGYLVLNFNHVVEMQLMRPLSLVAMTDRLLADRGFSPGIDTDHIGGFGASLGGEAMLHLLGARITTTVGFFCHDAPSDPRVKVAVAYVPYARQTFRPAFCESQSGVDGIDRPFLALSGNADTTAPIRMMDSAMRRMKGSSYLIEMAGVPHEFKAEYAGDLLTWMVTFFRAYMHLDGTSMDKLVHMKSVVGGPQDSLRIDMHMPDPSPRDGPLDIPALEFRNSILNHYFIASNPTEIDFIQTKTPGPGWELTGQAFNVFAAPSAASAAAGAAPVCRFYGGANGGPNSHFFTAVQGECDFVKGGGAGGWYYEGIGFYERPVDAAQQCPAGLIGVKRAYNNRALQNDSNHRFSVSDSTMRDMQGGGWVYEATGMCGGF